MRISGLFASPLAGTAVVLIALAVLAVPLHRLTSSPAVVVKPSAEVTAGCVEKTPSVLRLKLLAPAQHLTIGLPGGPPLLDLTNLPAGESEHDVLLTLEHGVCELELSAEFGAETTETAIFLTAMPDGLQDITLFTTGTGLLRDVLRFEWPHDHDHD